MKRIVCLIGIMLIMIGGLAAQAALDLAACIDAALAAGPDAAVAARNLDVARATHALNQSKNGFALAASGALNMNEGFSFDSTALNTALLAKAGGSNAGLSSSIQAGLTLTKGASTSPFTRLALTASQGFNSEFASLANSTILGLSVAQTVWDGYPGGQVRATVDKSVLTLRGKELQAVQSASLIVANVKKAYVTMLTAQRTLALRLGIADKQKALLKQITAVYAIRQATTIDLQTAQINAKSADLDVETSRHDLALARQRLANLLGMPPDSGFSVAEIADAAPRAASLEDAVSTGLAKRIELAQADLSRRSSAIDLALAKGQSQASINLTGGLNVALDTSTATTRNADYATLGLRLGLPVLDAGAAAALVASSSALVGVYSTTRKQLEQSIAADIRDAWWTLDLQVRRIDLALQSRDLFNAKLALVKAQNSMGTATNQELMTAVVDAATAEATYATAKSNYLLAVIALETAMGL